jgi:hypothetical protein
MNFYIPKLMKIRWSSIFLDLLHLTSKSSIHGSNLNSIPIILSELKFFLLTGVLIQNFNDVDLVKFLEKIKNFTFRS